MHVHLKITIIDRIIERLDAARRVDREVEAISVTPKEYAELRTDIRSLQYLVDPTMYIMPRQMVDYSELKSVTRDYAVKKGYGYQGSRYRVMSREKFMGINLFVVPDHCVMEE
jgi:hypothetical protein